MTTKATEIQVWTDEKQLSAAYAQAVELFRDGNVPESAKFTRPMRGGKMSTYIKHQWVSAQLRNAFGPVWSMEVKREQAFPDHSGLAIVRLINYIPTKEGIMEVAIEEAGAFMDETKQMPAAYVIAAAVSRGLVKCVMRRTGCGESLYNDNYQPTAKDAALTLFRAAQKGGISKEEAIAHFKEHGITSENVIDKFAEAYQLIYELRQAKSDKEVGTLFDLKPKPASPPAEQDASRKPYVLNKSQIHLLNKMIDLLKMKVDEKGFGPRVDAANEKLASRDYGSIDTLDKETCQAIVAKLEAATTAKDPDPQRGPLADQDKVDALCSWAHDLTGMSEETVINILNETLEEGDQPIALGFEFIPYDLTEAKAIIQTWIDADE